VTRPFATTASCLALAAATAGCGGGGDAVPPERPADPGEVEVPTDVYGTHQELLPVRSAIGPDGLSVRNLAGRAGSIVEWTNRDDRTHRLESTSGSALKFRSPPIAPGEQFRMTIDAPGRTRYRSTTGGEQYRGILDAY
jgi:hypothetical protein